jgi:hypothetical protein
MERQTMQEAKKSDSLHAFEELESTQFSQN